MKFYIYLWGYIFVPFIQINLHYFNTDLPFVCRFASLLVSSTFNVWTSRLSTSSYFCDLFQYNYWYCIFIESFRNEWNCDIFYSSPHSVYALFIGPICRLVSSSYQQNTTRNSWTSRCRYRSRTTDIFPHLRWHLLFWVTVLLQDVPSKLGKHPFINYSCGNLMLNNFHVSIWNAKIYLFRYSPLVVLT